MTSAKQRIRVSNVCSTFATLWLEPWGEDYGMLGEDEFEVVASEPEEGFYFHVGYGAKGMKIYAEGDATEVSVYQNGQLLECGHNRRREEW